MHKRCIFLLAFAPFAAAAEEVTVIDTEGDVIVVEQLDETEARAPSTLREVPTRGMSMSAVRNAFGPPRQEHAAVGEPPITRWDYDGYSVFFEHDKVLHSVVTG